MNGLIATVATIAALAAIITLVNVRDNARLNADQSEYSTVCLGGHEYWVRNSGRHGYMAPKFNSTTGFPERCGE